MWLNLPRRGRSRRPIGAKDEDQTITVLRAYGIRELAAGFGILSQTRPAGWLWGRVAGDLLDIASLGKTLSSDDSNREERSQQQRLCWALQRSMCTAHNS